MIRHIVFFSAKSPEHVDTIVEALSAYKDIPGVRDFHVSKNIKRDQFANDIDVVLHAVFADEAALEAYKNHPIYAAGIKVVRPIRELRFAVDCEVAG